jgi:hypothetical protein
MCIRDSLRTPQGKVVSDLLLSASPSPDKYNIISEFDKFKSKHVRHTSQVFSFGADRAAFKKVYLPDNKVNPDTSVPGPGTYDS